MPGCSRPAGYVHGGMLFTVADYAMGATARSLAGEGTSTMTLEAKINYLTNVREGRLIVRCQALHRTKRLVTLETRITDAATDELMAIVTGTFYFAQDEGDGG